MNHSTQASQSITNSQSLLKLVSSKLVMPSNCLILCCPLLLLLSIFPSIRVFSSESVLHIGWPRYWSFSFNISPSNKRSGLISFRMDWLHLLAVQRLSGVFSNTTVQKHQFFGAELSLESNSHIHTQLLEKPYPLTRRTFVGKGMCLLFNMLSRLVIASKEQVSLNFMAVVTICSDFGAPKNKVSLFPLFPHLFAVKWWDQIPWS